MYNGEVRRHVYIHIFVEVIFYVHFGQVVLFIIERFLSSEVINVLAL